MESADGPAVQMSVLYWGIALGGAIITGLFKAVAMRGKLNQEWGQRVGVFEAGLDELAAQELRRLRLRIDDALGRPGEPFDPLRVVVDPAQLLQPVRQFQRLLKARRGARWKLDKLLRLGTLLTLSGLILLPCIGVLSVHWSGLKDCGRYVTVALVGVGTGTLGGTIGFFLLWYLQDGLAKAEVLSQQRPGDG
jgi:hypothetical protein